MLLESDKEILQIILDINKFNVVATAKDIKKRITQTRNNSSYFYIRVKRLIQDGYIKKVHGGYMAICNLEGEIVRPDLIDTGDNDYRSAAWSSDVAYFILGMRKFLPEHLSQIAAETQKIVSRKEIKALRTTLDIMMQLIDNPIALPVLHDLEINDSRSEWVTCEKAIRELFNKQNEIDDS